MPREEPLSPGLHIIAPLLFSTAAEAYTRMKKEPDQTRERVQDGLIAVVFSCATLEGFIAEAAAIAATSVQIAKHEQPVVERFARVVRECEDQRGQVTLKFQVAHLAVTGAHLPTGAQPYQDFADLVHLRNQIVHWKEEPLRFDRGDAPIRPPKTLRNLAARLSLDQPQRAPWQISPSSADLAQRPARGPLGVYLGPTLVRTILDAFPVTDLAGNQSHARDQLAYRRTIEPLT